MIDRHPDPCASFGEISDALRACENFVACIRNEAERIKTGSEDGCADIHHVGQMMALRCQMAAAYRTLEEAQRAVMARINAGHPPSREAA